MAQPVAAANAGSSSRGVLGVIGPAWLRSSFGCVASHTKEIGNMPTVTTPVGGWRRLFDVVLGFTASAAAILVGVIVWGLLFDSTGGEPFSSTVFGALFMWPLLLIIIVCGPIAWWHYRGVKARLVVFGSQLLGTHAAIGLSWLLY